MSFSKRKTKLRQHFQIQCLQDLQIWNRVYRIGEREMEYSKIMKERIHRCRILFQELQCEVFEEEMYEDTFSAGFQHTSGFQGVFFIDRDSRFIEIAYSFSFSRSLTSFLSNQLTEILKICYEYGCYTNIETEEQEINLAVYTKIYFAGLNYYSLKETIRDFKDCVLFLKDILSIRKEL